MSAPMVRCSPNNRRHHCRIYIAAVSPISVAHTTYFGRVRFMGLDAQATCFKQADLQIGVSELAPKSAAPPVAPAPTMRKITFTLAPNSTLRGV